MRYCQRIQRSRWIVFLTRQLKMRLYKPNSCRVKLPESDKRRNVSKLPAEGVLDFVILRLDIRQSAVRLNVLATPAAAWHKNDMRAMNGNVSA